MSTVEQDCASLASLDWYCPDDQISTSTTLVMVVYCYHQA